MAGAISIVVEDGTGTVAEANSYVSAVDAVAYALQRGVTVANTTDEEQDALSSKLIKAMDYLAQYDSNWQGSRLVSGQPLAWPRECVYLYGDEWPAPGDLPVELYRAQLQLVLEQVNGVDLFTSSAAGYAVRREKVGPIETEYDTKTGSATSARLPIVDGWLKGLLRRSGFGFATVYRG